MNINPNKMQSTKSILFLMV